MKKIDRLSAVLALLVSLSTLSALAGPTASINDTSTPPRIDGELSDWTIPPVIVLDKKESVVIGQGDWTGPDYASAKVFITYDKKNLYIAADIQSKNPQYNEKDASEIYNGDGLEVYVGTDLSNPQRKAFAPTDIQFIISPGKKGDNAQIYSMTDQGVFPNCKIETKLTAKGYTLEAAIPLANFFKIDVGPGKSIGFDLSLDDTGATSKTRAIQLSWAGTDKSWQDPSLWGSLQFKGNTVFVNTAAKNAMPGAVAVEIDPSAGKKNASSLGTLLWGFNGDTGGFTGQVVSGTEITTEGTGALVVNTDGSSGWNQNLAECSAVPMADKWVDFKSITMDVYYPAGSLAKANYGEIFLITQSPASSWNQAMKVKMKEGWNHLKQDVDSSLFKGGLQKVYIVFNSGGPIAGKVIIDNIRGVQKGAAAKLRGKVTNKSSGAGVSGALVAIAKKVVKTGKDGSFSLELPEDEYTAEVFAPGFKTYKETIHVKAAGKPWAVGLVSDAAVVKKAVVDVFFDKKIRSFDPHYMFGNNIAAWHEPKWFTDPAALKKITDVTSYIRVPGGAYANIWRWKTGEVLRKDGVSVQWVPETKWSNMVDFVKKMPNSEAMLIANIMTMDVQNALDWIEDAKANGIKVKYVEMGNEPDYEADLAYNGAGQYWTVIDNYCAHYIEFAKAIKAKYPDIKLMGPTPAQFQNHERKEGAPWLAPETAPWWVERFLEKCGPYVDVVSVHSYPYWSNDSDSNLLSKTALWSEYVPKIREAIQKNIPDRYNQIEIAVSEWNSGDENATTARLINGIFTAEYLAQMMVWGVNQTNIWDLYTQKPGLGGGHGLLDPNGDPERPYAERAHYWALLMMKNYFGTTLYQAVSNSDELSAYASTNGGKRYLMVINKSSKNAYKAAVNLGATLKGRVKLDIHQLSPKEYQWSENLYRAVINSGPSHLKSPQAVGSRFEYAFPPYSITCIELIPAK